MTPDPYWMWMDLIVLPKIILGVMLIILLIVACAFLFAGSET